MPAHEAGIAALEATVPELGERLRREPRSLRLGHRCSWQSHRQLALSLAPPWSETQRSQRTYGMAGDGWLESCLLAYMAATLEKAYVST
jgi:hypothetical protein